MGGETSLHWQNIFSKNRPFRDPKHHLICHFEGRFWVRRDPRGQCAEKGAFLNTKRERNCVFLGGEIAIHGLRSPGPRMSVCVSVCLCVRPCFKKATKKVNFKRRTGPKMVPLHHPSKRVLKSPILKGNLVRKRTHFYVTLCHARVGGPVKNQ